MEWSRNSTRKVGPATMRLRSYVGQIAQNNDGQLVRYSGMPRTRSPAVDLCACIMMGLNE